MKKVNNAALHLVSAARKYRHVVILVLIIGMFVLAAGAPNATIGIGK